MPSLAADDLVFSVENMDQTADPAEDFYRHAAGGWMDRVEHPERFPTYGIFSIMGDRLTRMVAISAAEAGKTASDAPKGSPEQLVGDFYNAYMNVEAIDAAWIDPIRDILDRVAELGTLEDLTRFMADQAAVAGPGIYAMIGPSNDPQDNTKHALYSVGPSLAVDRHFVEMLRAEPGSAELAPIAPTSGP